MLFASTELAARIERAEARLVADCTRCAARRRPDAQTHVLPIGGGVATFAGPSSPLDKLIGLGFEGPVSEAELAAIEQTFARNDTPLQVELSCLADPSIARMLTGRGYRLAGFENVLGLALAPDEPYPTGIDVEITSSGIDELPTWLDVVVTGFANPDAQGVPSHEEFPREALEQAIGDMAAAEGFSRWLARRAGEIAGGASLRMSEGVAQLCGAATLPAHRRHGVQTALLGTRLAAAARAGCDLAVVTTLPGSKSQHNVQRRGFELLYTRAVLVHEPG
jgi:GNAT superfamily N-acetyltransferase